MRTLSIITVILLSLNLWAVDLKKQLYGIKPSLEIKESKGPKWQELIRQDVSNKIDEEYINDHFDDHINHNIDFESCAKDQIIKNLDSNRHDGEYYIDDILYEGDFNLDKITAVKKINSDSRSVAYALKPLVIYHIVVYAYLKPGFESKNEKGKNYERLEGITCEVEFTGYYFYANSKKTPKSVEDLEFLGKQDDFQKEPEQLDLFN